MEKLKKVSFRDVDIIGGFWADRQEMNRKKTIFAVEDRFDDTGRFEAFECGWHEGCENVAKPHFFWDSDIANLYWESLLKLFGYATDENNRFTAEEWENAVVDEFDKCFLTQMEIEDEAEKKMIKSS